MALPSGKADVEEQQRRRVVAKAENTDKGDNPRFVVTSLRAEQIEVRSLYEDFHRTPGDMENRIKEQQLGLAGAEMAKAQCSTIRT